MPVCDVHTLLHEWHSCFVNVVIYAYYWIFFFSLSFRSFSRHRTFSTELTEKKEVDPQTQIYMCTYCELGENKKSGDRARERERKKTNADPKTSGIVIKTNGKMTKINTTNRQKKQEKNIHILQTIKLMKHNNRRRRKKTDIGLLRTHICISNITCHTQHVDAQYDHANRTFGIIIMNEWQHCFIYNKQANEQDREERDGRDNMLNAIWAC